MFHRYVGFVAVVVSLGLTGISEHRRAASRPNPVSRIATAAFRCNGPTAATRMSLAPRADLRRRGGVPDAITGDGNPYVGAGTTVGGSGAFLRSDGELEVILRTGGGRLAFLNFESVLQPPGSSARKTFDFADLDGIDLNTNVINRRRTMSLVMARSAFRLAPPGRRA